MRKRDIYYYQSLSYDVIARRQDETILLLIPELSLAVSDKDINRAYIRINEEKDAFFTKMCNASLDEYINEPYDKVYRERFVGNLLPFFIKLTTFSIAIIVFVTVSVGLVRSKYDKIMIYAVKTMEDTAVDSIPGMSKQKRDKLHKIIIKIKPLVDELRLVFSDDNQTSKETTPKR